MTDNSEYTPVGGVEYASFTPGVIVSSVPSFDSESEDALALRFGRRQKKQEDLVFEFTRDPGLLHQYHLIYEEQFRAVHSARNYRSIEDEHDRRGHVIIARHGNLCIGGARLSVRTPRQPHPLPIEMNDFRLEKHFPELDQKQLRYGQIGRICLLPQFRGGTATRIMMWHLYRKVVALGLDRVFGTATIANARVYRQNCLGMGLKDVKIHQSIELPPYPMCEEIRFYLISGSVDKTPLQEHESEFLEEIKQLQEEM